MAARKFSPHGIPPPEKLKVTDDSALSQNYRRFIRGWNNYEVATNLKAESSEFRCAIFMTTSLWARIKRALRLALRGYSCASRTRFARLARTRLVRACSAA